MDWIPQVFASSAAVMAGSSEKVPIASAGPEDVHQFMPPVSAHRGPISHFKGAGAKSIHNIFTACTKAVKSRQLTSDALAPSHFERGAALFFHRLTPQWR